MTKCTVDEKDFGVFLIHCLAERWDKTVPEICCILNNTDIFDGDSN